MPPALLLRQSKDRGSNHSFELGGLYSHGIAAHGYNSAGLFARQRRQCLNFGWLPVSSALIVFVTHDSSSLRSAAMVCIARPLATFVVQVDNPAVQMALTDARTRCE